LNYGYGALIIAGGLFAFMKTGSSTSLLMAALTGFCLIFAGFNISNPKSKLFGYRVSIAVTGILIMVMGYRFYLSGKFMPAGFVLITSLGMTVFNAIQLNNL